MPNTCLRTLALGAMALLLLPVIVAEAAPAIAPKGSREDWDWTLVDPKGLALGGGGLDAEDVRYVHAQGFRAVLNYRAEHPDDEATLRELGMEYLLLPVTYAESDTMPVDHVHQAVAFIEENLAEGKPVYVHCTGGWHRSAVGVVAYYMKANRWRMQEAWDHVAAIRPGIETRYADVLYEYEAFIFGEGKLTLDLWTERWDVEVGETVGVTALVTHHGKPVEGAKVAFAGEHKAADQRAEALTGPDGRATFSFTAPKVDLMQYVRAVATKEGFVAGYDRNVYWVTGSKPAPATEVEVGKFTDRVSPSERVVIPLTLREGGKPSNVRVTLTTGCATLFRAYSGWDGKLDAAFDAPTEPGVHTLRLSANRFPAEPVVRELALIVGETDVPAPPCVVAKDEPATPAPPAGSVSPAAPEKAMGVPAPTGALIAAALAVAALLGGPRGRR